MFDREYNGNFHRKFKIIVSGRGEFLWFAAAIFPVAPGSATTFDTFHSMEYLFQIIVRIRCNCKSGMGTFFDNPLLGPGDFFISCSVSWRISPDAREHNYRLFFFLRFLVMFWRFWSFQPFFIENHVEGRNRQSE